MTTNPFVLYKASLITNLECLERRADRGEAVYAREITRLFESYGTSFDELPRYLQAVIDRINLADQHHRKAHDHDWIGIVQCLVHPPAGRDFTGIQRRTLRHPLPGFDQAPSKLAHHIRPCLECPGIRLGPRRIHRPFRTCRLKTRNDRRAPHERRAGLSPLRAA